MFGTKAQFRADRFPINLKRTKLEVEKIIGIIALTSTFLVPLIAT